ncbi:MAG TPA: c-type cytochrome [Ottowia sp.]|uniref:c-type cytochrome n=1 Tax=Ottowia sp. TaxID=1898956 RepID=UPI0025E1F45E|nr:c-type cytochrome [Ottowia sp.]HMN57094.1 c-type cytochrome [Ottowia sp.]
MKPPQLTLLRATSLVAAVCLAGAPALAQPKTGESVYRSVCMACHDTGVAHAPKKGDAAAWKPLIEEGQHVLSAHAFVGVRAMPAKGGDEKLTLQEFSRAVAWMARESGGDWQDPDAAMMHRISLEAEKRLDADIRAKQKLKAELHRQDQRRQAR